MIESSKDTTQLNLLNILTQNLLELQKKKTHPIPSYSSRFIHSFTQATSWNTTNGKTNLIRDRSGTTDVVWRRRRFTSAAVSIAAVVVVVVSGGDRVVPDETKGFHCFDGNWSDNIGNLVVHLSFDLSSFDGWSHWVLGSEIGRNLVTE